MKWLRLHWKALAVVAALVAIGVWWWRRRATRVDTIEVPVIGSGGSSGRTLEELDACIDAAMAGDGTGGGAC